MSDVKIYHVETQEDYDDLMIKLEEQGYMWLSGDKPTSEDCWAESERETIVCLNDIEEYKMTYGFLSTARNKYSDRHIIKYKAGDTLEFETDKAKELQKYREQIAKKKEELSNKQTQDNHKLFNEIITDLEQTYIAKNKDYGNSFEESLNEFGEIAGLVRIGDKFNRAKNLSENKANVIDESKIDTYLDMANYCIMQAMWLMKSKL